MSYDTPLDLTQLRKDIIELRNLLTKFMIIATLNRDYVPEEMHSLRQQAAILLGNMDKRT